MRYQNTRDCEKHCSCSYVDSIPVADSSFVGKLECIMHRYLSDAL